MNMVQTGPIKSFSELRSAGVAGCFGEKHLALRKIDEFDYQVLYQKFLDSGIGEADEFEEVVEQFKQFLALVLYTDGPIAMLSRKVDELWHAFIIHTPQYREFCEKVFGEFIDHQPHSASTPVPREAIVNLELAYKKVFNRRPDNIWYEDLNEEERQSIRKGVVPESFEFKWSGWVGRRGK